MKTENRKFWYWLYC